LFALHYITRSKQLIGDITLFNVEDTAASMCQKLLENLPSFQRFNRCKNNLCYNPERKSEGTIILFPVIDGSIDLQQKIDIFLCLQQNYVYILNVTVKEK